MWLVVMVRLALRFVLRNLIVAKMVAGVTIGILSYYKPQIYICN